jgi:serine/threonine-protein kinase RsbW
MSFVDAQEALIRIAVPARAEAVHLLRSVAASVGARMSMTLDDVEEIRIAVDEAATLLLTRSDRSEGSLELELTCTDTALSAAISLRPPGRELSEAELRASWPWRVISAITDEVSTERSREATTVTFVKKAPGSSR